MQKRLYTALALSLLTVTLLIRPVSAAPNPDPTSMLIQPTQLTLKENGALVVLTAGRRLTLQLGGPLPAWQVTNTDPYVLTAATDAAFIESVQGVYVAAKPGTTELRAVGTYPCQNETPRCLIASPFFHATIAVEGARSTSSSFVAGQADYRLDGRMKRMGAPSFIENDRTYVPVAAVATMVGAAPADLLVDQASGAIALQLAETTVTMQTGSTRLYLKTPTAETLVQMDVAPVVRESVLYLPVRWFSQAFGYRVSWDDSSRTVSINP